MEPWPTSGVRRASINSFGYGGANAHAILEAWPPDAKNSTKGLNGVTNGFHGVGALGNGATTTNGTKEKTSSRDMLNGSSISKLSLEANDSSSDISTNGFTHPDGVNSGREPGSRIFLLTAKDEAVVQTMVENLKQFVTESNLDDGQLLDRLAYTLSEGRSRFPWTIAVASRSREELLSSLDDTKLIPTRSTAEPRLCLVFTGQGAQWYAMGRELIGVYPVFTETLYEADQYLKQMGCPWSLLGK